MAEKQNGSPSAERAASITSELGSQQDIEASSGRKPQNETPGDGPAGVVLRPYQDDDVDRMRERFLAGTSRLCYQLATGGGKTIVFVFIAWSAVQRGRRVLILAHRQEISDQISAALTAMGVAHGMISPGFPATTWPVQVASVFTIARRLRPGDTLPFDLIVIDEAHHATAGSWRTVLNACPNAKVLGVTATPVRLDGKGLDDIFQDLVCGPDVATLTAGKFLAQSVVFTPAKLPNLARVRIRAGDYALDELSRKMSERSLIARAVADYKARCAGVPAVAFGVDRRHSELIAEAFRNAGFRASHVDSELTKDERARRIAALGAGEIDVLSNCGLISEGVDLPAIGAAILLRPTQSLALYLQQVGRALRPAPGKERAVILDHAGNVLRHGLPDAPRTWSLQASKIDQKRHHHHLARCAACGAVTSPAPFCSNCGAPPRPAGADLETWLQVTKEPGLAARLRSMSYAQVEAWADTPDRARIVEMVRGFKRGWAWHRARELEERTTP